MPLVNDAEAAEEEGYGHRERAEDKYRLATDSTDVKHGKAGRDRVSCSDQISCLDWSKGELRSFLLSLLSHLLNQLVSVHNNTIDSALLIKEHDHETDKGAMAILATANSLFKSCRRRIHSRGLFHAIEVRPEEFFEWFLNTWRLTVNPLQMSNAFFITALHDTVCDWLLAINSEDQEYHDDTYGGWAEPDQPPHLIVLQRLFVLEVW